MLRKLAKVTQHIILVKCYNTIPFTKCYFHIYSLVLVAHNGFGFDFLFLTAEIQRRLLVEAYNTVDLWFADTLREARTVSITSKSSLYLVLTSL